jgi:hypothetical protein
MGIVRTKTQAVLISPIYVLYIRTGTLAHTVKLNIETFVQTVVTAELFLFYFLF